MQHTTRIQARRRLVTAALLAAGALAGSAAWAQPYPHKPITFIVPFPPGGPSDIIARLVAQNLAKGVGQPVIVDNRPGAAGFVGMQLAARAAPDGYTIVLGGLPVQVLNPVLYPKLPYDPVRDFAPVALLAKVPYMLVASPTVPATDLPGLVRLAQESPGKLNYGSPGGSGNTSFIAAEMLKKAARIDVAQIPYQGDAQSVSALMAGDVQMQFALPVSVISHIHSGRIKAIAMASSRRSPLLPEVATFAEQGLKDFDVQTWFSVLAPAKTPPEIVMQLNTEINRALSSPELRERFGQLGAFTGGGSPSEVQAFIRSEEPRWKRYIKESGASAN
ncbi:MAG: tripartite tricarboxylate transporter substrate binding protein [Pseudomonadota bacterium]